MHHKKKDDMLADSKAVLGIDSCYLSDLLRQPERWNDEHWAQAAGSCLPRMLEYESAAAAYHGQYPQAYTSLYKNLQVLVEGLGLSFVHPEDTGLAILSRKIVTITCRQLCETVLEVSSSLYWLRQLDHQCQP